MNDIDRRFLELENLIWALMDDQLTPQEVEQIKAMIHHDVAMQQHYDHCLQIHLDMINQDEQDSISPEPELLRKEKKSDPPFRHRLLPR